MDAWRREEAGGQIDGVDVTFVKTYTPAEDMRAMAMAALRQGLITDIPAAELAATPEQWTYGWKVTLGEHQYGDYVTLSKPTFDEAHPMLVEQVQQVIKQLKHT